MAGIRVSGVSANKALVLFSKTCYTGSQFRGRYGKTDNRFAGERAQEFKDVGSEPRNDHEAIRYGQAVA